MRILLPSGKDHALLSVMPRCHVQFASAACHVQSACAASIRMTLVLFSVLVLIALRTNITRVSRDVAGALYPEHPRVEEDPITTLVHRHALASVIIGYILGLPLRKEFLKLRHLLCRGTKFGGHAVGGPALLQPA